MDSGDNGSMQSSSGGDEENDSPFLINPSAQFTSISIPQPHPLSHPPTFFDPPSHNNNNSNNNNLGTFSHTQPNPLYNLDLMWSRNLRSEPNYTEFGHPNQSLLGSSDQPPIHNQLIPSSVGGNEPPPKNPKKRTRASRRAPTTVLTTDTTNFRQMVQEFTGIPAAPFSASPYSRRLDFLSTVSSANRSGHLGTLGPLLRPAAHKVQPSPYPSSSSSPLFFNSSSTNIATSNIQSENILNSQNPIQTLHSLLQLRNPLGNEPIMGTRAQGNSRVLSLAEMGINQENFGARFSGFPSQGSVEVREGNYDDSLNVSSYKLQPTATAASDLHPGKGLENVSSRGEGMVDSWICPSD